MSKKLTELVFILDKSGSMGGLESDTIGGYNSMLKKQQEAQGDAVITTVLFNDKIEIIHDRIHVKGVSPLTEKDYEVGGTTALLDAIGYSIQKIRNVQKRTKEELRADHVLFVITTDGMENSSREFSAQKIREMIEYQKKHHGWEFVFLGANIDAIATAKQFGINEDYAVDYHADSVGTNINFEAISDLAMDVRQGKRIDRRWKDKIERDYNRRNKR